MGFKRETSEKEPTALEILERVKSQYQSIVDGEGPDEFNVSTGIKCDGDNNYDNNVH